MWQLTFALTVLVATVVVTEAYFEYPDICDQCACNAECVNNASCQCKPGYEGDPTFHCYQENSSYCHIKSDPMLRTFSVQHFKLSQPGTFLLVDTTLDRVATGGGECDLEVNVTLTKIGNRIYASALQFELVQRANSKVLTYSFKVVAFIDSGDAFAWDIYYLNKGDDNNPWLKIRSDDPFIIRRTISATNCEIEFLSYHSYFLKVRIFCCGILVAIRQKSDYSGSLVPGVFLELDADHNPELTPDDGSLCGRTF